MNDHKEHIKQYSAADIQRYLQGKLSATEMHALEKAALDDPFLADAIEGMEQALKEHDEKVIVGKLQEARQQVINRTTTKSQSAPVIAFRWWKVAAAAAVLIIGTVWVYTALDTKTNTVASHDVLMQKTTPPNTSNNSTDSSVATSSAPEAFKDMPAVTIDSSGSIIAEKKAVAGNNKNATKERAREISGSFSRDSQKTDSPVYVAVLPGQKAEEKSFLSPTPGKPTTPRKMEEIVVDYDLLKKQKQDTVGLVKTRSELSGKVAGIAFEEAKSQNLISGRVINENNAPLPNASLYVENYRSNITTDKAGIFKIPTAADSVVDVSVVVVGYGTQRFRLQNNAVAYNQLQLQRGPGNVSQEQNALSKTAENDDDQKLRRVNKNNKAAAKVMVQEAQPVYGWVSYEKYLEENKQRPAGDSNVSGEVVVSFEVSKKGNLSDFKIEQSLAKTFDQEAIRLIKEGPRWKSVNGRKSRVTIIVRF